MTPPSPSYLAMQGHALTIERLRLQGLTDRAKAAYGRCKRQEDRDCLQAEMDIWKAQMAALACVATQSNPDTRVGEGR